MIEITKGIVHKLGRAYINRVVTNEVRSHTFTRHNERPLEFGFVFQQIAALRPVTVLDVGTGTTALPHLMASCGCVVTAIDNVKDYWDAGMVNRHWLVLDDDIRHPKLADQFDMVTCVSVIEHIEDHLTAFKNMIGLLKPGGHLVVTTQYSELNPVPNVYKLQGAAYGQDAPYICRSTSRRELDEWIRQTGAELVKQEFYRLWTGPVWTQGEYLPTPKRVTQNDAHQLSLMLFRRPPGEHEKSAAEQDRINDLLRLMPRGQETALDVGAKDGYISALLTDLYPSVTALDLERPRIAHDRVVCVKGDVTHLDFPDDSFDTVLCAEVLEHIDSRSLVKACSELARVARRHVVIGVPYRQELRADRMTCASCGERNPPWGHVNSFDENRLIGLFGELECEAVSYVGSENDATNFLSTWLLDVAGNPYGTYGQEEPCAHCGSRLLQPPSRRLYQRAATRIAMLVNGAQRQVVRPHANWIHLRFGKRSRTRH